MTSHDHHVGREQFADLAGRPPANDREASLKLLAYAANDLGQAAWASMSPPTRAVIDTAA